LIPVSPQIAVLTGKTVSLDPKTAGPLKLTAGQVVEARVLKPLSSGTILLGIQGRQIQAATRVPVPGNAVLSLMVSGKDGNVSFRVMDIQTPGSCSVNPASIRGAMATHLWAEVHTLLEGASAASREKGMIRAWMGQLARMTLDQPGAHGLKSAIQHSGLCWEHKLVQAFSSGRITQSVLDALAAGDLKGMISKLLTGGTEKGGSLLKALHAALENIQLLNVYGSQQAQKLFVPLPLQFYDGTWGLAQILFHLPTDDGSRSQQPEDDSEQIPACAVTVILELSRLGTIRADLQLKGQSLQGKFLVDRSRTLEKIESRLSSFTEVLAHRGLKIGQITCHLADTAEVKKDLITQIIPQEGSSVCFVA
jgi:hypothetical protein